MRACKVIVTSPVWSLNGVNSFAANLVRGLCGRGVDARLVLTHSYQPDHKPMPLPSDLPVVRLTSSPGTTRKERLGLLRAYLGDHQPCIYLPNHDFEHSSVCQRLPAGVYPIGILHSDDPEHYDHFSRLGRHWRATVAVSDAIVSRARGLAPELGRRVKSIPYGVCELSTPSEPSMRRAALESRIELVYAGRIVRGQKRILDLERIARKLLEREAPFRLTVAGGGRDLERFLKETSTLRESGHIEFAGTLTQVELQRLYVRSHVAVLPSAFEGLSLFLLEAMACGCVPVATAIASGTPQLIRNGENGYVVELGDIEGFVKRLLELKENADLWKKMSERALGRVRSEFDLESMLDAYERLFEEVSTRES